MDTTQPPRDAGEPYPGDVDAVMRAAQVLVAVTAQSVASVADHVTLPQLRVLVMIASRGPQNLTSVAQGLGVHPSNATRTCNKLVDAGLLHRSDDPADRRNLILELTSSGRQLVHTMTERRRAAIASVLAKMPPPLRTGLISALSAFAEAADEIPLHRAWALGWATEQPGRDHAQRSDPCTPCGQR